MVKAAVDVAVTVIDPPKETDVPLIVTAELVRLAFATLLVRMARARLFR